MPYHLKIKNPTYAKNEEATNPNKIIITENVKSLEPESCITPPTTTPANTSLERSIKNLPSDCRNSLSLSFCSFLSITSYRLANQSLPFFVYVQARNAPKPTPIMISKNINGPISLQAREPILTLLCLKPREYAEAR